MANFSLKGSERAAMPGARKLRACEPDERLQVTVLVRRCAREEFKSRVSSLNAGQRPGHLSREQFASLHGADAADFEAVRAFAASHGLTVTEQHPARRTLLLVGTVQQFCAAFHVHLDWWEHPSGNYRGREGAIQIPQSLAGIVVAVLGLDNRPQARPHFRVRTDAEGVASPQAADSSFSPLQVAQLYQFPPGTGQGQCVAVIELGGGFNNTDLKSYFQKLVIGSPQVLAVSVDQGSNAPTGDSNGPDGEVMLDIEVIGAIAPQARIAVYFAPNTDAGFLDAITTAIHDTDNKPSVISISWGGPESAWTGQAMTAMDEAFQAAATMGISVCVASGDNGSSDGVDDGAEHVDFPASSPHALACGGTRLAGSGAHISSESVWNDGANGGASGGGISTQFPAAAWQANLSATDAQGRALELRMRGVPDVAGNAEPQSGYQVRVDGADMVIGGTSAVAPLWAGLLARLNQNAAEPLGFLNPALYQHQTGLRDITQGNNGDFTAAAGWDACTGLGSPNGVSLAQVLSAT